MKTLSAGFLLSVALLSQAFAAEQRYHPEHLFVKVKPGQELAPSQLIHESKQIIGNLYLVKTKNIDKLAAELSAQASIEYIEKDYYSEKQPMPKLERLDPHFKRFMDLALNLNFTQFNDPEVNKLWAFEGKNGMDVVGAYAGLPARRPEEVIVAVVDTGVDHNHEDLRDVMWTNPGEIPGDGIDNDGNGYIDDVYGINPLIKDEQGNTTTNTMASHWHGTHVAGTIAATQNNGVGIAGVANNVKIMAIRTVPDTADELDSDIVESFKYAAEHGAKIINCSFGKKHNEGGMVVRDVIEEIGKQYGVLVIASAGNDSWGPFSWADNDVTPKYPASFESDHMMVVASTTSNGGLSSFTNIGARTVHVAAPGSNIYSTLNGNRYGMASGTSMAAPNASGVAAMVLGYYPHLSGKQVKEVLMASVVKVNDYKGKMASEGRVNLNQALQEAAKIKIKFKLK
jgi:thermitase